jgi:hydroxymethylpyrimidine/phosphomethylpyrimidine kinase
VDPVMVSKNGTPRYLPDDAVDALKTRLLPNAFLLTPNLDEAALLTGDEVRDHADMRRRRKAGRAGAASRAGKGRTSGRRCHRHFVPPGRMDREFTSPRIETRHTHGTGCTFSAAITASLAAGHDLPEAVERAKRYVTAAIRNNPGLGSGAPDRWITTRYFESGRVHRGWG